MTKLKTENPKHNTQEKKIIKKKNTEHKTEKIKQQV